MSSHKLDNITRRIGKLDPYGDQHCVVLDQSITSQLLKSKISDLSIKEKIESILNGSMGDFSHIDTIRDRKFIIDTALEYKWCHLFEEQFNLWDDRNYALQFCLNNHWKCTKDIPDHYLSDKDFMYNIAKYGNYWSLSYACDELFDDREYLLKVLDVCGNALCYVHDFSNDRQVVMRAVSNDGMALNFASDELQNDREIVLQAIKQNGQALGFASDDLKNDRELVLCAVRNNGEALEFANEFTGDREVVWEAISQNGLALRYVSEELRNDYQIVDKALSNLPDSYDFIDFDDIGKELRNERKFISIILKKNGRDITKLPQNLKNDREIVLEAVIKGGGLDFASENIKNDREIVLQAVKNYGYALGCASENLRSDREIVLEAVKAFPNSIHDTGEVLKRDETLIMEAIRCEANIMKTMDPMKALKKILKKGPLQIFRKALPIYNETFEFIKQEYSFLIPTNHPLWDYLFETEEEYQGYEAEEEYEDVEEEGEYTQ